MKIKILCILSILSLSLDWTFGKAKADTIVPHISGPTDEEMLIKLKNQTKDQKIISIDSFGGNQLDAAKIGTYINDHKITIFVKNYCLSSCAMYVLAGSPRVIISKSAIVGFHVPAIWTAKIINNHDFNQDISEQVKSLDRAVRELYSKSGKNIEILRSAFYESHIHCVQVLRRDGKIANMVVSPEVDVWIPSRNELESQGWNIEGYWPNSQAEAEALSRLYLKPQAVVRYGTSSHRQPPFITMSETACPGREAPPGS